MSEYALLISDRAGAAFFERSDAVVLEEVRGVEGCEVHVLSTIGNMRFVRVTCVPGCLPFVVRLSCVQGVFKVDGDTMIPLDTGPDFALHPDFVFGEKYRGKTNETLTQLMINIGLQHVPHARTLLDPMCGRGTSLFWAMRYGLRAVGVEQDGSVLAEIRRGIKKWTKLHRQKHKLTDGWVQKTNKKGIGQFLEFSAGDSSARILIGDSVATRDLVQRKRFDLLVTDLPYGVQHMGGKGTRNPLDVVTDCAPGWAEALCKGGAMVIAFNAYQPKRSALEGAFAGLGLEVVNTDLSHRMSESILRDVLVLKKPA